MNYAMIRSRFDWVRFENRMDRNVTYASVLNKPIRRLTGESYITTYFSFRTPLKGLLSDF